MLQGINYTTEALLDENGDASISVGVVVGASGYGGENVGVDVGKKQLALHQNYLEPLGLDLRLALFLLLAVLI